MRLTYVEDPPTFDNEQNQAIADQIEAIREPRGLNELDLTLLLAPPVADGWTAFEQSLLHNTHLPPSLIHTAISRVATITHAWLTFQHHAPLLCMCADLPEPTELLNRILYGPARFHPPRSLPAGFSEPELDEKLLAVLEYVDYMTLDVEVPEHVLERVRERLGIRETVELTAVVAAANARCRVEVALDVGERKDAGPSRFRTRLEDVMK